MKTRLTLISLFFACCMVFLNSTSTLASPEECQNAIDDYNTASSDVADQMKSYASCFEDSNGKDDCATEFRNLQSAQDDFENAVNTYQSDCD